MNATISNDAPGQPAPSYSGHPTGLDSAVPSDIPSSTSTTSFLLDESDVQLDGALPSLNSDLPYLGKNGWWIRKGPEFVCSWKEDARGEPYGMFSVTRAVWDSALGAQSPVAPAPDLPPGPESVERDSETLERDGSLDTVQTKFERPDWDAERDNRDNAVIAAIAKQLDEIGETRKAERMRLCGVVRGRRQCLECSEKQPVEVYYCGYHLLCPRCARIHAKGRRLELLDAVKGIDRVYGCRWNLLTLTVRTDGDQGAAMSILRKAFGDLYREVLRYSWDVLEDVGAGVRQAGGRFYLGKRRVFEGKDGQFWQRTRVPGTAAFRSIEFGPDNLNVHAHILLYSRFIPQAVISREWERLTGSCVLDIRQVRPKGTESITMADAVDECCKYVTKIGSLPPGEVVALWQVIRGRRLSERYGAIRGLVGNDTAWDTVPCPNCGSIRYKWLYVPFAESMEQHLRGPPN